MTDLPMPFAFAVTHSNGWRGYDGLLDVGYAMEKAVQAAKPHWQGQHALSLLGFEQSTSRRLDVRVAYQEGAG